MILRFPALSTGTASPSVWREWIEIRAWEEKDKQRRSPSVWREWIEMRWDGGQMRCCRSLPPCGGSGLKLHPAIAAASADGLPPCGGSGLKFTALFGVYHQFSSPSVWREWIEIHPPRWVLHRFGVSLRVEGVD